MPEQQEGEFALGWNFFDRDGIEADGTQVKGAFVRIEEGPLSDGGVAPIVVLDVGGEERSIWVLGTVLRNQFAKALGNRQNFDAGEIINVSYLGKKKGAKYTYNNFAVRAENTPTPDARSLFGTAAPVEETTPVAYESAAEMAVVADLENL